MTEPAPPPPPSAPLVEEKAVRRVLRWIPLAMAGHLLVGLPTLVISLVVAYGTYVQARATQKMQQAAAWPFLSYGTSNINDDGQKTIAFDFTNEGVGPALIGPVEVRYRGRVVRSARELLRACCGNDVDRLMVWSPPGASVIRPGSKLRFLYFYEDWRTNPGLKRLSDERMKFDVRACYCSIFDECWTIRGMQAKPKPIAACPTDWKTFDEQ